jgi:hypothetical protein
MSLPSNENLTALETLATIICESGGARFLRVERVKGHPALVLFCSANVLDVSPTPIAMPITELSTLTVRKSLLALENPQSEEAR